MLIATNTHYYIDARSLTLARTHIQEKAMQRFELEKKNLVTKVIVGSGCGI